MDLRTYLSRLFTPSDFSLKIEKEKGVFFIERVIASIKAGKKIFVYGDYDTDGIVSSIFIIEALKDYAKFHGFQPEIDYKIPGRAEGYGIDIDTFRYLRNEYDLVITCDNGTHAEFIEELDEKDMSHLLVLDHHPNGDFSQHMNIINPNVDGGVKISTGMIGEYLFQAMRRYSKEYGSARQENHFRDLTAITLVSDMADRNHPVVRKLIRDGLEVMGKRERAIYDFLFPDFKQEKKPLTAEDLSFSLINRLNSAGRIGVDMDWIYPLFSAKKRTPEFEKFARRLIDIDDIRRTLSHHYMKMAEEKIEKQLGSGERPFHIVVLDDCPIGLNGLIAGSLSQKYSIDLVVLSPNIHAGGAYVGSGRGENIKAHFSEMVSRSPNLRETIRFGGHPAAIGIHLEDISPLENAYRDYLVSPLELPRGNKRHLFPERNVSLKKYKELCREYAKLSNGIPFGLQVDVEVFAYIVGIAEYRNGFSKVTLADRSGEQCEVITRIDNSLDVSTLDPVPLRLSLNPNEGDDEIYFCDIREAEKEEEGQEQGINHSINYGRR
jgi:single-stranded DNA-specific DHH superfamily exonuclease